MKANQFDDSPGEFQTLTIKNSHFQDGEKSLRLFFIRRDQREKRGD